MRKSDKERRDLLKTLEMRMVEIQDAQEARLGGRNFTEAEIDEAIEKSDEQYRQRTVTHE